MEQIIANGPKNYWSSSSNWKSIMFLPPIHCLILSKIILTPTSDPESSIGPPVVVVDQVKQVSTVDYEKYSQINKTVCWHLLNHLSDPMFDLLWLKIFQGYLKHFGILVWCRWCRWCRTEKVYCWKVAAVSDERQQVYCGTNSQIWKPSGKCSIWRNEDVWNTPSECTAREIFSIMERLSKSPEALKELRTWNFRRWLVLKLQEFISHMQEAIRLKDKLTFTNLNFINANLVESSTINKDRSK